mgnify:CR=1 FL=1
MQNESSNIIISFIIGLMGNIISFYLLTLKAITLETFIAVIIGFILLILIIGIQTKYNNLKDSLEELKANYQKISESLKINERLTRIELSMKNDKKKWPRRYNIKHNKNRYNYCNSSSIDYRSG